MKNLNQYILEKLNLDDDNIVFEKDFEELKDFDEFFNGDFDEESVIVHLGDVIDNENNILCCWGCIEYFDEDFSEIAFDPNVFLIFNDKQFNFFIEKYKPEMDKQMNNYLAPQWLYDKICNIGVDGFEAYVVTLNDFLNNKTIKGISKIEKFKREIKKIKDKLK